MIEPLDAKLSEAILVEEEDDFGRRWVEGVAEHYRFGWQLNGEPVAVLIARVRPMDSKAEASGARYVLQPDNPFARRLIQLVSVSTGEEVTDIYAWAAAASGD